MSTPNALIDAAMDRITQYTYVEHAESTIRAELLAAIAAASAVPPGYAIVPIEPTRKMIAALFWEGDLGMMIGHSAIAQEGYADYANMLAAAPQPPAAVTPVSAADLAHVWETIYDHGAGKHKGAVSAAQRQKALEILERIEQPLSAAMQPLADEVHSCSFFCNLQDCIKTQRDLLRDQITKDVK